MASEAKRAGDHMDGAGHYASVNGLELHHEIHGAGDPLVLLSDRERPPLPPSARFWRSRRFARVRHRLLWLRRSSPLLTRAHARLIRWTGGRIRRSFIFTGGMPLLVLTTVGRRSGKRRSTPIGYLPFGDGYAVLASNAGSDRVPAWWLNLQADPVAEVLADRTRHTVRARRATVAEDELVWADFARLNAGFDEYRSLTRRRIPVVILETTAAD